MCKWDKFFKIGLRKKQITIITPAVTIEKAVLSIIIKKYKKESR